MDNKEIFKVFVYGTLKEGRGLNSYYMGNSTFIKKDTVKGNLYSLGSYPALTKGNNDVPGEIWEMPKDDFETVTRMEESAGYKTLEVETESKEKVLAYFQNAENFKDQKTIKEW